MGLEVVKTQRVSFVTSQDLADQVVSTLQNTKLYLYILLLLLLTPTTSSSVGSTTLRGLGI